MGPRARPRDVQVIAAGLGQVAAGPVGCDPALEGVSGADELPRLCGLRQRGLPRLKVAIVPECREIHRTGAAGLRDTRHRTSLARPVHGLPAATTWAAKPFRPGGTQRPTPVRKDERVSTDASAIAAVPASPAEQAEPVEPQAVVSPLTKAAIFLVAVVNQDAGSEDAAVSLCADLASLV